MVLSVMQTKYFTVIKRRSFWSFLLYTGNISQSLNCDVYGPFYYTEDICISQLLNCEVYGPFYFTEIIFRSYSTAKFSVLSIMKRKYISQLLNGEVFDR